MEIVLHALNGVLTIMLMIAVGFYLERRAGSVRKVWRSFRGL